MGREQIVPVGPAERDSLNAEVWQVMREQAMVLVKSGFLPPAVNTPEKAISIVMKGRELGVPPMYALSNIAVINGRPTGSAELMLALIYRDHGDDAIRVTETSAERCAIAYKRRGWKEPERFSFSLEDAHRAGLSGKDNWRHYPAAMLRARCISAVARLAFPDTIGGLYTPEELGAAVQIDGEGATVVVAETVPLDTDSELGNPHPVDAVSRRQPLQAVRADSNSRDDATEQQRAAIAKLSRMVGEPCDPHEVLDSAGAARRIRDLAQRYNSLDAAERRRRAQARAS